MAHPYETLAADRFWRTGVAELDYLQISGLWQPKLRIRRRTPIVTAGSCFAQHFARALTARGYRWMDHEPGPASLTAAQKHDYHYGTFSFRTGNIYTPRMLLQWLRWALAGDLPPTEVWESNGRFYDPFRPGVEPDGFVSVHELRTSRAQTLEAVRKAVTTARVFVFTLGLTEAWQNRRTGIEYAACPGTVAGSFDDQAHVFINHRFSALMADMTAALDLLVSANPALNLLLTVSPVPLTATASGQHVLTATSHSKSLLRAVASELCESHAMVDYFPSYEIITHPAYRGRFFAPNLRSVLPEGVDHVMNSFFRDQATRYGKIDDQLQEAEIPTPSTPGVGAPTSDMMEAEDLRCEEEILAAFAPC